MKKTRIRRPAVAAGINITPLIDILLVLLVIFMTMQTSVSSEMVVSPLRDAPPAKTPPKPIIVGIDGAGAISIDGTLVETAFRSRLQRMLNTRADTTVLVRGNEALRFQAVASVIDEARMAGAVRVGLMPDRR